MVRFEDDKLIIEIKERGCTPNESLEQLCTAIIEVLRAQSAETINVYAQETLLEFLGRIMPVEDNIDRRIIKAK